MSVQSPHRARAEAIVTDENGVTGHTVPRGRFSLARKALEKIERSAIERAVSVTFKPYKPLGGYNNPLDGRDLGTRDVVVRIGYVLDPEGSGATYDASGADSGAADLDTVEDRAESDAKAVRDAVSWQGNWTGLDPDVIDCAPHPEGDPDLIVLDDRVIREVRFLLTTRANLPGDYGPSQS